ncbi:hypothetical protein B296_00033518 [Ensete ventricosum]|uniref:Uncharacterized protein n=1 Tax=Ensete ventricosum TaxID=4639 RepID=A0A427AAP5_ENSVE|nr:hypothetical protein B296_00033518 [Ensete ventricosum]
MQSHRQPLPPLSLLFPPQPLLPAALFFLCQLTIIVVGCRCHRLQPRSLQLPLFLIATLFPLFLSLSVVCYCCRVSLALHLVVTPTAAVPPSPSTLNEARSRSLPIVVRYLPLLQSLASTPSYRRPIYHCSPRSCALLYCSRRLCCFAYHSHRWSLPPPTLLPPKPTASVGDDVASIPF